MEKTYFHFWGHTQKDKNIIDKSCLSQWFPSKFIIDNVEYLSAEQYMMAKKASLFKDKETEKLIMESTSPKTAKALGRKVKGFEDSVWTEHSEKIVYDASIAKFTQNKELKNFLLSIEEDIIVESSPFDKVWGTGLTQNHPDANNEQKWLGTNKLGFILTKVRDLV